MTSSDKADRRRFRFSVRLQMLAILVVALGLGWRVEKARTQREAVSAVRRSGGVVGYDYEFDSKGDPNPKGRPPGPRWLQRRLGPEYFGEVYMVAFEDWKSRDELEGLEFLDGLTRLRSLYLDHAYKITDDDLAHLERIPHLRRLWLGHSRVGDAGLAMLKGHTEIQDLYIEGTPVTDAGLVHLREMKDLRVLDLRGTKVSDDGLANLAGFKQLKELAISGSGITDRGLDHLKGLTKLERLYHDGTRVSDAGLAALKQSLPRAWVHRVVTAVTKNRVQDN